LGSARTAGPRHHTQPTWSNEVSKDNLAWKGQFALFNTRTHTHARARARNEFVFPSVESDRNEVRHTDPHCTLLLLLLPVSLFGQWEAGEGEWLKREREGEKKDGDRRRLAFISRDGGIKRRGSRPRVYSNIYAARREPSLETMRARGCSIQAHGSSSSSSSFDARTSGAADSSQARLRDSHRRRCPPRRVSRPQLEAF